MSKVSQFKVERIWAEASGIQAIDLVPVSGEALPAISPGAHIDVHLPNGVVRQYSLCNDPRDDGFYRIAVKLEEASRGGSRYVHSDLRGGALLTISEPRNNFTLSEAATEHLLLAGGIGITPLLAMAKHLTAQDGAFRLLYFVRQPEMAAFETVLEGYGMHARILSGLNASETSDALREAIDTSAPGAHLYVCGPAPFMERALELAHEAGWDDGRLHREYFSASVLPPSEAGSFEVGTARTGLTVQVGADETIVQALERAGLMVDVSCEQGVCGTCLTKVLQGEPEHHDVFQTDAEKARNDHMCLCVSRARSPRLILDI